MSGKGISDGVSPASLFDQWGRFVSEEWTTSKGSTHGTDAHTQQVVATPYPPDKEAVLEV